MIDSKQIISLTRDHQGAVSVMFNLAPRHMDPESYSASVQYLIDNNIVGSALWLLYKETCDENIIRFINLIKCGISNRVDTSRIMELCLGSRDKKLTKEELIILNED